MLCTLRGRFQGKKMGVLWVIIWLWLDATDMRTISQTEITEIVETSGGSYVVVDEPLVRTWKSCCCFYSVKVWHPSRRPKDEGDEVDVDEHEASARTWFLSGFEYDFWHKGYHWWSRVFRARSLSPLQLSIPRKSKGQVLAIMIARAISGSQIPSWTEGILKIPVKIKLKEVSQRTSSILSFTNLMNKHSLTNLRPDCDCE